MGSTCYRYYSQNSDYSATLKVGFQIHKKAMKELPIIPIDDAFIGVCLRKLGLRPTNHKGFKSWGIKYLEQNNCVWNEVMTFHKLQPEELEQMWKAFVKRGMVHNVLPGP